MANIWNWRNLWKRSAIVLRETHGRWIGYRIEYTATCQHSTRASAAMLLNVWHCMLPHKIWWLFYFLENQAAQQPSLEQRRRQPTIITVIQAKIFTCVQYFFKGERRSSWECWQMTCDLWFAIFDSFENERQNGQEYATCKNKNCYRNTCNRYPVTWDE